MTDRKKPGVAFWATVAFALLVSNYPLERVPAGVGNSTEPTDDQEERKTPGEDNPVLKEILNPDGRVKGEWGGPRNPLFEDNILEIEADENTKDSYRLHFFRWTDYSKPERAKRVGSLVKGKLTLDKPIKGFGVADSSFDVLYLVRTGGKDFLVPSVNAEKLRAAADLKPKIAFQLRSRHE